MSASAVIYYFSGTGNSLEAAKQIAAELDADVLPIAGNMHALCAYEKVGVVFPVYFWGIPPMVQRFLETIRIVREDAYIFAAASCGGMSGGALGMIADTLNRRGLRLQYGAAFRSVANYIVEYPVNPAKAEKRLAKAAKKTAKIGRQVNRNKRRNVRRVMPWDRAFYNLYMRKYPVHDRFFAVHDSCIGCGQCAQVCPADNITLREGRPQFAHRCEHCLACLQWCPKQAIDYKQSTAGRARYTNPHIKAQEIKNFRKM